MGALICRHVRSTTTNATALKRCKNWPGGYRRLPVFVCLDCGRKFTSSDLKKERA